MKYCWIFFVFLVDATAAAASDELHVGDSVRVKPSVKKPKFKWNGVSHSSVGVVLRLDDDGDIFVRFPEEETWRGRQVEMEKGL